MIEHPTQLLQLELQRLSERAVLPAYQTALAAGLDLAACLPEGAQPLELIPIVKGGGVVLVPCGFAMAIPPGFEAQIRPRSGLAVKFGVSMPNTPGTIDADYRGEIKVPLINLGQEVYRIEHAARIAQMVLAPVARALIHVVPTLSPTARGEGGFGSTGVRA